MMIVTSDPDQIPISCLHDPFVLRCPLCGGDLWEQDGPDAKCGTCGLEMRITQEPEKCRLVLGVLGA
jgi:hypothetical protein